MPRKASVLFFADKVAYLGFIVSKDGISPYPAKVEAIATWPIPRSVFEVHGFLGLIGWCRVFVQKYAFIIEPLTQLNRNNESFTWSKTRNQAFNKLKEI